MTINSEDQLQAACFQWGNNSLPVPDRGLLWAVPNGKKRSKREAMVLKATGVIPGVHDLHLWWKGILYTFELKWGSNTLTDDQEAWAEKIDRHGGVWYEIRSYEQFQQIFLSIIS